MALSDCSNVSYTAFDKLYEFSLRFADYNSLLSRIAMNMFYYGTEIYSDINKATAFLASGDYYNAGLYGGLALEKATR